MLPLLYVSRLDVADGGRAAFAEWYSRRHAPDLVGAGFLSVSSFRAVRGEPWVCNVYELPDLDAFGPAYQQARASDDEGLEVQKSSSNQSLAVYEQVLSYGFEDDGGGSPRWRSAMLSPVMGTFRFSAQADDDQVLGWYRTVGAPRVGRAADCLSVRLGRQVDAGRPNVDPRRWSLFVEWANVTSALRWAEDATAETGGNQAVGVLDPSLHVLRRHSMLHHPDAWHA